jgi:hypothetical protein
LLEIAASGLFEGVAGQGRDCHDKFAFQSIVLMQPSPNLTKRAYTAVVAARTEMIVQVARLPQRKFCASWGKHRRETPERWAVVHHAVYISDNNFPSTGGIINLVEKQSATSPCQDILKKN